MKSKVKPFIAGLVIGAISFGTIGAYGASNGMLIEIFHGVNNIVINGVSNMPSNKPFIYNGSTYVPLRYISENLGETVSWDRATRTVYIGEGKESTITSIAPFYLHLVGSASNEAYTSTEIATNGKYNRFASKVSLSNSHKNGANKALLKIFADGQVIYSKEVGGDFSTQEVDIAITGAANVRFEMVWLEKTTSDDLKINFESPKLIK